MNIPKYHEIQLPILEILSCGKQFIAKDLEPILAIHFKLTDFLIFKAISTFYFLV